MGCVQDRNGNTYVSAQTDDQVIYKIDTSGNQTVYAGKENNYENNSHVDPQVPQTCSLAKFRHPKSMTIDTSGSNDILYLVDERVIKKINPYGTGLVYYITGTILLTGKIHLLMENSMKLPLVILKILLFLMMELLLYFRSKCDS
jgi:hypothetical protein